MLKKKKMSKVKKVKERKRSNILGAEAIVSIKIAKITKRSEIENREFMLSKLRILIQEILNVRGTSVTKIEIQR
jgi:hypothetical protein